MCANSWVLTLTPLLQIRAMLICNPTNPHGRTHSRQTLLEYCLFAEKHDLHLVSDEIYGLSVYDNPGYADALPFTSMLNLDVEKETGTKFDRSRLHVVHGASKGEFGRCCLRLERS